MAARANAAMSLPGDDLLQYLIQPPTATPRSSPTNPTPTSSPPGKHYSYSVLHGYECVQEKQQKERSARRVTGSWQTNPTTMATAMEIETPRHPVGGDLQGAEDAMAGQVLSMEAFLNANPRPVSPGAVASLPPNKAKANPPQSKQKSKKNAANSPGTPSDPPKPVALGSRSSKDTIAFHEKHQALGLPRPEFVFGGSPEVGGWNVKVSFCGVDLEAPGPFNSKGEAKEALSGQALEALLQLEREGIVSKPGKRKKSKASVDGQAAAEPLPAERKEPGINYKGQLLEFQRSRSSPQPTYADFQLGTSFSCVLTLEPDDPSSGENAPQTFGSQTTLFPNKKAAQQDAARCAIDHLKATGLWPTDSDPAAGIRKKKKAQAPQSPLPLPLPPSPAHAGRNSSTSSLDAATTTPTTTAAAAAAAAAGTPGPASYGSRVAHLALQLGLATPEWRFHDVDPAAGAAATAAGAGATTGFHTVSCHFRDGGPHAGPIGTVRHIFGRKKAKEECARLTLAYLVEVWEGRWGVGERVFRGEGVVEQGKGKEGVGVEVLEVGEDGDGESGSETEFEDAVEEM